MVGRPGGFVVLIEAEIEVLQPLYLLVDVVLSTFFADNILDDDASSAVELIPPVAILLGFVEINQILGLKLCSERILGLLRSCLRGGSSGGRHGERKYNSMSRLRE